MEFNNIELTLENVLEFIGKRGHVSFAELTNYFKGTKGEFEYALKGKKFSNAVLWSGMSEKFCDVMDELREQKNVEIKSASIFLYYADGMVLKYPILKSVRHYKEPHWVPVTFNLKRRRKV